VAFNKSVVLCTPFFFLRLPLQRSDMMLLKRVVTHNYTRIYRVSQEECAKLREGVPYVKLYRYNSKRLCPKLNGYGDNGQKNLKF